MTDTLLVAATLGWWVWSILVPAVILLVRRQKVHAFAADLRAAAVVAVLLSPGLLVGHGVGVLPVWATVPIIVGWDNWSSDTLQMLAISLGTTLTWFAGSFAVLRLFRKKQPTLKASH